MNAHDTGREHGFTCLLSFKQISKAAFERIGSRIAQHAYKRSEKQQEYLQGWMENWRDEPLPPLPPGEDILTF